ncbi:MULTISPECIES: hypothetical protein [unclassified Bradyrhizobium]|uniref:hypothetical protein n=1 Tax=unclassified Bradyrhizobium TaxID=2631580 RepID=UPI0029167F18|nr:MULTISPECIES: hypothetical protein [unclassified Bradyrhizobium]
MDWRPIIALIIALAAVTAAFGFSLREAHPQPRPACQRGAAAQLFTDCKVTR